MSEETGIEKSEGEDADLLALRNFLLDIDCLDPLDEWADQFNIFDVLGIARAEIRHSNMLGWLLDPNENHGLGDAVVRGFLNYVVGAGNEGIDPFDALLLDCHEFAVRREWRNIDILAVSAGEKFVICIENKIGTGEHDDQLNRYRGIVESNFPRYKHVYIYLSPNGDQASDPDHWCAMSYRDVIDIVEEAKAKVQLPPDVKLLVDNFIETIRRDVVGDDRLEQICAQIYAKHRRALDLIYEYRADRASSLAATIRAWAEQKDAEGLLVLDRSRCNKTYTRFTTRAMSAVLPDTEEADSGWRTHNHYFYEIVNEGGERFKSQLSINFTGSTPELLKRFDSIFTYASSWPRKAKWNYHVPFTTRPCDVDFDMTEEEIFTRLDEQFEKLMQFQGEVVAIVLGEEAQGA